MSISRVLFYGYVKYCAKLHNLYQLNKFTLVHNERFMVNNSVNIGVPAGFVVGFG